MNAFIVFWLQIPETQPFFIFFAESAKHSMKFLGKVFAFAVGTVVIFLAPSNYAFNVKRVPTVSFEVGLFLVADAAFLQGILRLFPPNPCFWLGIRWIIFRNLTFVRMNHLVALRLIYI